MTGGAGDDPIFTEYCQEVLPQAGRRASFLSHTIRPVRLFLAPIAAYRRTQTSSLQLGLRVGGHLALTDFGPDEPQ